MRVAKLLLTLLLALSLPSLAQALTSSPTISIEIEGGSGPTTVNSFGTGQDDGDVRTWTLDEPLEIDGVTVDSWMAKLKEDPFITNNISVQNNTGVAQVFTASVFLPIPAFAYDQVVSSSFGVTVTDGGASGGTADGVINLGLGSNGNLYTARVNGSTVLTLDPATGLPLTTADCPTPPGPGSGCTATGSNGVIAMAVAPGVANSLALELSFSLSAGDSAGFTSRFEIVPEPSTALLLGLGLTGLAVARRPRA